MKKLFKLLLLLLLLCGESGVLGNATQTVYRLTEETREMRDKKSQQVTNPASLRSINRLQLCPKQITRRIKDIDCWQFNTKVGKVILTDYKWENHIQVRHPFVTTEAIRKALEHPMVVYKSNKRWIFEKDNLRVVVGNEKVVTAYYMDGR